MRVLLGRVFLVVGSSLITFNISCHSLLACRVSVEKSADNLTGIPFFAVCRFSLAVLIFYLSLIFVSLITVCLGVLAPPWVFPAWDLLCFLDLVDCFLSHVREVFSYDLFKYFLRPFLSSYSRTPIIRKLVHLMLPQRSLWRRQWHPTPVLLPGESQGPGSLVGCRLWGRTESDTTEAT